jgi:regulator of sirC expression with transglutaminase-like and TPR domain
VLDMPQHHRERLVRVLGEPGCDLAEAALLCCAEVEAGLDVDAELLRLDALADRLRSSGFEPSAARAEATRLGRFLAGDLGVRGDELDYHDPRNGLLTSVLDRRRGLPITLAIVYVAIGRRVGMRIFGLNTPGHFLVGVRDPRQRHPAAEEQIPVVVDAFHGGALLGTTEIDQRIRRATAGLAGYEAGLLRPAPAVTVTRRLLNNLTRDFLQTGDTEDALWTVELKRLLPGSGPDDVETEAELLVQLGRYRRAAETLERYLEADAPDGVQLDDLERLAVRARAKMN